MVFREPVEFLIIIIFFKKKKKKNRPFTTPRYTLPYSDVQGPPPRSIARYVALYKGSKDVIAILKDLSSDPHGNEAAYKQGRHGSLADSR